VSWAGCEVCGGALLAHERAPGVCGHCGDRGVPASAALAARGRMSGTQAREVLAARADLEALAAADRVELAGYTARLRATGTLPVYASQRLGRGLAARFQGARHVH